MQQESRFTYMTQTPIPKLVTSLAVPTVISMMVTSFYNMADTFFVGKINTSATAAVGVSFSLMALIQATGFLFGHGSGNYISRKLGEKNQEDASVMASNGFFLSVIVGLLIMISGLIFLEPLAYLLGSTDTILPYAKDYIGLILIGAPYMCASFVLNNQLRYQGSAAYAMVGIVSGAVINILLDPLFIFTFDMGIRGAALATIISQFVSFILLCAGSMKGGILEIRWKNFKPNLYYGMEILRGGFPSLCRQGLASIAVICLNHFAGFCGDAAIAGLSIVSRVSMFANSALIGFGQGFQPVCGFNYGAKLYGRVREAFWFCVKWGTLFLLVIGAAGFIFAPQIVAIFRKEDAEVIEIGALALKMVCLSFPLGAWIMLCNMMMQAIGKAVRASVLAAAKQGLFLLPLICLFYYLFGLLGLQIAQPVADLFTFLLALPLGAGVLNEMKQQAAERKVEEIEDTSEHNSI